MTRQEALRRYPGFGEDMVVRSRDGEKLGTIVFIGDTHFVVEKGMFFPRDFKLRYDEIDGFRNGELFVSHSLVELSPWRDVTYSGWMAPGTGIGMFGGGAFGSTPDLMPQLMHEANSALGLEEAPIDRPSIDDLIASGTGEDETVTDPNAFPSPEFRRESIDKKKAG